MVNKSGFTIIEAIISFFITILLLTQVFQFSAKFYSSLLERSKFNNIFLENYSAFDHIARNLSQAYSNRDNFKAILDTQIIWRDNTGNIDIGYIVQDNNLYFVTGSYKDGVWLKQRKNLLSSYIKEIKFTQIIGENDNYISAIVCSIVCKLQNKDCEFKRVIGLKNWVRY